MANLQWQTIQSNYQSPVTPRQVTIENTVKAVPMAQGIPSVQPMQVQQMTNPMPIDTTNPYMLNTLPVQNPQTPVPTSTASIVANTAVNFATSNPSKLKYNEGLFNTQAPMIVAEAQKAGLNPSDLLALTYIESKFDPNAQNTNYGGLGQIDKRKHSRWSDPQYNIQETVRLNQANRKYLEQQGIKTWDAGTAYLAHQQGLGGAVVLLKNPNITAAEALKKTSQWKDKSLDWINKHIIRANGGKEGMLAKEFTDLWVNKANNYSQQFEQLGQQHGGWHNYSVKFRG